MRCVCYINLEFGEHSDWSFRVNKTNLYVDGTSYCQFVYNNKSMGGGGEGGLQDGILLASSQPTRCIEYFAQKALILNYNNEKICLKMFILYLLQDIIHIDMLIDGWQFHCKFKF